MARPQAHKVLTAGGNCEVVEKCACWDDRGVGRGGGRKSEKKGKVEQGEVSKGGKEGERERRRGTRTGGGVREEKCCSGGKERQEESVRERAGGGEEGVKESGYEG